MTSEEEPTEIDVMAEKYSKKWGVTQEEAKKKIQQFLVKKPEKPVDRGELAPTSEFLFPEPVGPLSKKIQDINQSALATAYTQKTLRELATPPKDLQTMKEKLEYMEKTMDQVVGLVNTTMKEWKDTLEAKKAEEEKKALLDEISGIIQPLKDKVALLEKAKEGGAGAPGAMVELTPEKIVEASRKMTEEATGFLKARGFNVEMPKALTIEEVEAKIKEAVEVTRKKVKEEEGAEVEIEKERIRATEEILTGITDRVFDTFLAPIRDKIHEAIEKGAFQKTTAPGT